MAGDWIKVECATPRKPEVLALARRLKIHADHAFGACFRFWVWAQNTTEDGRLWGVTPADIDEAIGLPGFAQALSIPIDRELPPWIVFDSRGAIIPNFDRHMSESAKNRAQSQLRMARAKRKGSQSNED